MHGGQFDWGGLLPKSNGGARRCAQRGRKSRNGYLSADERSRAVELSGALKQMVANVRGNLPISLSGESSKVIAQTEEQAMQSLRDKGWQPDYLVVRHQHDLSTVKEFSDAPLVVLGAARLGSTRLIDNVEI